MLASAWMWVAKGQARPPWATWPCRDLSRPQPPDLSSAQGGDTDYLSEAPGVSRKEASGRRGPGTARSKARLQGKAKWGPGSQGHGMAVQALYLQGGSSLGKHAGPIQRRQSWPVWGDKCLARLERCHGPSPGAAWSCPGRGPSPGELPKAASLARCCPLGDSPSVSRTRWAGRVLPAGAGSSHGPGQQAGPDEALRAWPRCLTTTPSSTARCPSSSIRRRGPSPPSSASAGATWSPGLRL